ncbi:hypothetical protein SAMN06295998_13323 [Primorskyibacter flagellatus]|uniref:Uncharacterized protein n=1 Tax=Primorskyibacter flagellatus TaxID=1387277 RepID=A0A1W2EM46_9RHOB|nr:hypothetical protein SAMN06295998_13323 [Primorskyibacter flagellatus]
MEVEDHSQILSLRIDMSVSEIQECLSTIVRLEQIQGKTLR